MTEHPLNGKRVLVRTPPYEWNEDAAGVIGIAHADGDCFNHRCEVKDGHLDHHKIEAERVDDSPNVKGKTFHQIELLSFPAN